jgi:hypothetical protein
LFCLFICLLAPLHAESSENSVEIRKEIDSAINEISAMLSFFTYLNVFYCLLVMYAIMIVLYTIIHIKKIKDDKIDDRKMLSIKIEE